MPPIALTGPLTRAEALERLAWLSGCLEQQVVPHSRTVSGSDPEAASSPPSHHPVCIDLSGLTRVDTAAVAVMLALERKARVAGLSLLWQGIPASLVALLHLSSVAPLFQRA